jgi:molybdopterin synthase sulfur carrier subunit
MIRVVLPLHLRTLAKVDGEVLLEVAGPVTTNTILDTLETCYPMLCGTVREHETRARRPRVRFFALETDITHDSPDTTLPEAIANGESPFLIVGAVAGG